LDGNVADNYRNREELDQLKIKIQVIIESTSQEQADQPKVVEEITLLERDTLLPETLGLNLAEAKEILAGIQNVLATEQVKRICGAAQPLSRMRNRIPSQRPA
jgi:hypothetical protein